MVTAERERQIRENLGLVHTVANRFRGRGIEYDDLYQAGCIGLIKATDAFDTERGLCFSTYAVPMIIGEIRRFLRDNSSIRVSRSLRDTAYHAMQVRSRLVDEKGVDPSVNEIAALQTFCKELTVTHPSGFLRYRNVKA